MARPVTSILDRVGGGVLEFILSCFVESARPGLSLPGIPVLRLLEELM